MYKFKKLLIAFAGLLALLGAIALVTPRAGIGQAVKPPQDVRLVGTTVTQPVSASSPLPVSGSVNIGNMPSVNVASMPTVNVDVANTPSNPVPIVAPTPQTVLAFKETKSIADNSANFGPYDVSGFRDVRLSCAIFTNNCEIFYQILLSDGSLVFASDRFDQGGTHGSTLISVPGQKIKIFAFGCQFFNIGTATLEVYGRP